MPLEFSSLVFAAKTPALAAWRVNSLQGPSLPPSAETYVLLLTRNFFLFDSYTRAGGSGAVVCKHAAMVPLSRARKSLLQIDLRAFASPARGAVLSNAAIHGSSSG